MIAGWREDAAKRIEARILEHLPGKHDQKTHGRGKAADGSPSPFDDVEESNRTQSWLDNTSKKYGVDDPFYAAQATVERLLPDYMRRTGAKSEASAHNALSSAIEGWAETSDGGNVTSMAFQAAAVEEFDLRDANVEHFGRKEPDKWEAGKARVISTLGAAGSYRAALRTMYEATQAEFREAGITHVALFRGVRRLPNAPGMEEARIGDYHMQPLTSFSSDIAQAKLFAGKNGGIIAMRVPVSRVLSVAHTGMGTLDESEFVVLGGPPTKAVVAGLGVTRARMAEVGLGISEAARRLREAFLREVSPRDLDRYRKRADDLMQKLDRMTDKQVAAAFRTLAGVRRSVLAELDALAGRQDSFKAVQLQNLRDAIDRAAAELARRYKRVVSAAMGEGWEWGKSFQPTTLRALGIDLVVAREVPTEALVLSQEIAADLVTKVSDQFKADARRIVTLGIIGARSPRQIEREIADMLRTQPDRQTKKLGTIAYQAERIVRTEMVGVANMANALWQDTASREVPTMRKYWRSARDGRVRDSHVTADLMYAPGGNPGPIPVDEPYIINGFEAQFPHDPQLPAGERVNCRCVSVLWSPEWENGAARA